MRLSFCKRAFARVMLGDKGYDIEAGGIVFAPANTWMSLENTGTEDIQLIFIYFAPGFERYMRCTSTLLERLLRLCP